MAYTKNTWSDNDLITAEKLNKMEKGIEDAQNPAAYTLPPASKTALGGVKQAIRVDEAAGANVTKAEFKALLDALKAAGQMASS